MLLLDLARPHHGSTSPGPTLEERIQCLRRTHALHTRDLNRAGRLAPPIWEDTTVSFAAKVLDLPSLPQGSRSHYEKLLHERHWAVGHNSSMEATFTTARADLLTCSLCASPDRREADTYHHVFRLCPLPFCSFNVVMSATNNSHSTTSLPISSNACYQWSPNWFSSRKAIAFDSGTGTRDN